MRLKASERLLQEKLACGKQVDITTLFFDH